MTTMAHTWKPSPDQIELMRTVFAERVPNDEPNREQFWKNVTQNVSNRATFQDALLKLKARPRVDVRPSYTPPPKPTGPALATEDGLYRDPSDGTLYRLSTPKAPNAWTKPTTIVSVYSNKATVRRLTPEGRMVKKGKWARLKAQESRAMLSYSRWDRPGQRKIEASWLMSDDEKTEWAVGICLDCYRGLIDAVSVYNQLGPKCAKDRGIVREIPPAHVAAEIEKTVLKEDK